jgi:prepilin peptidase CpaA
MILVLIISFCAIIALGFGAAAALSDVNRLIIPNNYVLFILGAFAIAFGTSLIFASETSFFSSWKNHLLSGGLTFVVTFALFHFKVIGGGDAKLLSVYGLWVGLSGLMPLLFYMAVVGGVLGIMTLIFNKKQLVAKPSEGGWIAKAQGGLQEVPYGVAIFIGALGSFWSVGYLQPENLMKLAGG